MGQRGEKGEQGKKGPSGPPRGGVVYTHWGKGSYQNITTGAKVLYAGRVVMNIMITMEAELTIYVFLKKILNISVLLKRVTRHFSIELNMSYELYSQYHKITMFHVQYVICLKKVQVTIPAKTPNFDSY